MNLATLNIRRRLMAGFFTVVILGAVVCAAVLQLLTASIWQLENVVTVSDTIRQKGLELRFDMMTMSDGMRGYLIDPRDRREMQRKKEADAEFLRDVNDIKKLAPTGETLKLINRAAEMDSQSVNRLEDEVLELISSGPIDQAKQKYVAEYLPVRQQQEQVIRRMEEITERLALQAFAAVQSRYATVLVLTYALVGLLIAIGTVLSFLMYASSAKRAANGDIDDEIP